MRATRDGGARRRDSPEGGAWGEGAMAPPPPLWMGPPAQSPMEPPLGPRGSMSRGRCPIIRFCVGSPEGVGASKWSPLRSVWTEPRPGQRGPPPIMDSTRGRRAGDQGIDELASSEVSSSALSSSRRTGCRSLVCSRSLADDCLRYCVERDVKMIAPRFGMSAADRL